MSDSADAQIEHHTFMGGCGLSSPPSEWFCYSADVGGYLCPNCLEEAVVSASPGEDEEAEAEGAFEDYGLPPVSVFAFNGHARRNGRTTEPSISEGWLEGSPMDPCAVPAEPFDPLPGFPFMHRAMTALISGPTGGGRSSRPAPMTLRGRGCGSPIWAPRSPRTSSTSGPP